MSTCKSVNRSCFTSIVQLVSKQLQTPSIDTGKSLTDYAEACEKESHKEAARVMYKEALRIYFGILEADDGDDEDLVDSVTLEVRSLYRKLETLGTDTIPSDVQELPKTKNTTATVAPATSTASAESYIQQGIRRARRFILSKIGYLRNNFTQK